MNYICLWIQPVMISHDKSCCKMIIILYLQNSRELEDNTGKFKQQKSDPTLLISVISKQKERGRVLPVWLYLPRYDPTLLISVISKQKDRGRVLLVWLYLPRYDPTLLISVISKQKGRGRVLPVWLYLPRYDPTLLISVISKQKGRGRVLPVWLYLPRNGFFSMEDHLIYNLCLNQYINP